MRRVDVAVTLVHFQCNSDVLGITEALGNALAWICNDEASERNKPGCKPIGGFNELCKRQRDFK
jgi:hypothetical protein